VDLLHFLYGVGVPGLTQVSSPQDVGFKAYNLWRMSQLGLPVPPAFVIGTQVCREYWRDPDGVRAWLKAELPGQMDRLGEACGLVYGSERRPLLVSVRSGAPVSMPGMMDTVLNLGLNEASINGLLRMTGNPRLTWDAYRRLIQSYSEVVGKTANAELKRIEQQVLASQQLSHLSELDYAGQRLLAHETLRTLDADSQKLLVKPHAQLEHAVLAVFDSWWSDRAAAYRKAHGIADDLGTAVTVQRMVFGNAGGTSGSGVGFTRDPASGENRLYLDFLFDAQGEDVVSGRREVADAKRLARVLPDIGRQLQSLAALLEREFGDTQEFEFTVQEGALFLLQTRTAKRTPWAALRIAVEQVEAGLVAPEEALRRLEGIDLKHVERRRLADDVPAPLALATPAAMGVACGHVACDSESAVAMTHSGKPVILVREEFATEDFPGIAAAEGILVARGSRTSHAAVVARQMGKVCLVGCRQLQLGEGRRSLLLGGKRLREGDVITLDADGGRIFAGEVRYVVEKPTAYLEQVACWKGGSKKKSGKDKKKGKDGQKAGK
jgi:pyruvate, orthophosphate dikinase